MNMGRRTSSCFTIFVSAFVLNLSAASAFDDGGYGKGCCTGIPDSVVERIGLGYGVDPDMISTASDLLRQEPTEDLQLLVNLPKPACEAYELCTQVPDEFFRILTQNLIDKRSAAVRAAQQAKNEAAQRRNHLLSWVGAVGGLAGVVGVVISVLTYRREGKQSSRVVT